MIPPNMFPHFPFIMGIPHHPGPMAIPVPAPNPPPAPVKPFIPQSLESWVEQREKALGWRCDGTECLIAPSTDSDGDVAMMDDELCPEDKELLSIYSPLQARDVGDGPDKVSKFVILACEHRWHRSCLTTAERSCGRGLLNSGADGRVWVRCQRCRKDGWVNDVEDTCSEGEKAEVERLVTV